METYTRTISVIGLGYVGLPVAIAFARAGGKVIAFDNSARRIAELLAGSDRTGEAAVADLSVASLHFTTDPSDLRVADFHIVTVPTPIDASKQPDLSAL